MKKTILLLNFALFCTLNIALFTVNASAENTGASFLKLGIGARQSGLGNAFTGIADDISAIYYNPAGLANLNQRQLGAMHSEWIDDIRYNFLGFVNPLKNNQSLGMSVLYLYMGDIEGRNEDGSISGNFTSYDLAVTLSYSRKINPKLNLGSNLKFIYETIEKENAKGIAIDLGMLYDTPIKDLSLGLNIQNIGPAMKFISESYNLPLTVTGGLGYNLFNTLTVGMDIKTRPIEGRTDFSIGTEISPIKVLSFRAGYITKLVSAIAMNNISQTIQIRDKTGLGVGLGFKLYGYQLDYSFSPYENLGDIHRVSFIKRF